MKNLDSLLKQLTEAGVKFTAQRGELNCYVRKGVLTDHLRDEISKNKNSIIALLEEYLSSRSKNGEPEVVQDAVFPLSVGEKGLYFLQKMNPEASAYNTPICLRLESDFDLNMLDFAWQCVLDQYPLLCAKIIEVDGVPHHSMSSQCRTKIKITNIENFDEKNVVDFLSKLARRPFDLNSGPLHRIELYSGGDAKPILMLNFHHIIIDGASAIILLGKFLEFYECALHGVNPKIERNLPGYQRFVSWERQMLSSPEGEAHARYWKQQLDGDLPVFDFSESAEDQKNIATDGRTVIARLSGEVRDDLLGFSKRTSIPLSIIYFAAYELLLHRYFGVDEVVIGMPVMGRADRQFASDVGYFVNMVPLRSRIDSAMTAFDLLDKVRRITADAIFHSSFPLPLMIEGIKNKQIRKNPIFQLTFVMQHKIEIPKCSALKVELIDIFQEGDSDLGMEIFDLDGEVSVHLKFDCNLYSQFTADRILAFYPRILHAIALDSQKPLHAYSLLDQTERARVLVEFNDTRSAYPSNSTIHDLFVEQAARTPAHVALVCDDLSLSYGELEERSRALALYLQSLGASTGALVGLCMERSIEAIVGILGIVRAGCAYVPLDPGYPEERLNFMLEDSSARIVLTLERLRTKLEGQLPEGTIVIALDSDWERILDRADLLVRDGAQLRDDATARSLVYAIYTSGSTGRPKGVLVEHRSVNRLVLNTNYIKIDSSDVLLQISSLSFDAATLEIWGALLNGATLTIAPQSLDAIAKIDSLIERYRVSVLWLTSGLFQQIVNDGPSKLSRLRVLLTGGDVVPLAHARNFLAQCPGVMLINGYGPTENTTFTCCHAVSGELAPGLKSFPIGRPIANTRVYVLDEYLNPQPIGVIGELYFAGDGLARGYLNRPDLTREKFVPNPHEPGELMYRSGDLGRWLPDGSVEFYGRIDTQVKIRGFRIETGEIEACLDRHPGIRESVVVAQGGEGAKYLVAFYCLQDEAKELEQDQLREHVLRALPDYMVPSVFVRLEAIPLDPNGKVNRRLLGNWQVEFTSGRTHVAPRDEIERRLAGIWAQVLGVTEDKIGIDDNFFEIGGHSLLATQVTSKICSEFDVELPIRTVFENANIRALAKLVVAGKRPSLPRIEAYEISSTSRLPLSFAQERLWFIDRLEPGMATYNIPAAIRVARKIDPDKLETALNMAIIYLTHPKAIPTGGLNRDLSGLAVALVGVLPSQLTGPSSLDFRIYL